MSESNITNDKAVVCGSDLGKETIYTSSYQPQLLYPIPRAGKREELGISPLSKPPFFGFDLWTHYEVSWLNGKGKPVVAIAEIVYDCHSPNIIESKSLKLYFNSFNNTKFNSAEAVEALIINDLTCRVGAEVLVRLYPLNQDVNVTLQKHFDGESLDDLDIECSVYLVDPSFLHVGDQEVRESLYSDLLKSNCLVTNQPDWGSVQITYSGKKIDREGILKYLISFRNHNEFHEQCIERIFMDIMQHCQPKQLTVYGRYTRRGGLDINPYRSTEPYVFEDKNSRLIRQ
jgi:7-cyano-7-deazaguanine reductase